MKEQKIAEQEESLFGGGLLRVPLDFAGDKFLCRPEERRDSINRLVCEQLERILGLGRSLLAAGVKFERLVRDEIVDRRAIGVGHRAFLEQIIERRDGGFLERVCTDQSFAELFVDL